MSGRASEFSRLVPLARLGSEPFSQEIIATAPERDALARRFDLVSLDHLSAEVELRRDGGDTVLLRAEFAAEFAQSCVVTLDAVGGAIRERFELRYGPPDAEPSETASAGGDDPAFEPFEGEAIDIGEAVAQEFSLALPLFPRAPDAIVDGDAAAASTPPNPFDVLARFAPRRRD